MQRHLIVGLGNPGPQYSMTRHNIGFICLDLWAQSLGLGRWNEERKAEILKFKLNTEIEIILAKPMTFMNLSGEAVQLLSAFYKIPVENILVVHDDIDQPYAALRFHKNRGHGGHNGIRSISQVMATQDYTRLKLGVGRPENPEMQVADYVLGGFSIEEKKTLPQFIEKSIQAIDVYLKDGLSIASTRFNV
jgi:peptidyl-tRNA hydrolase, PTH1 family